MLTGRAWADLAGCDQFPLEGGFGRLLSLCRGSLIERERDEWPMAGRVDFQDGRGQTAAAGRAEC